ncbi:protein GLUTAMINE DUMPER 6-like protein [Carex littledalei]|uniref:Protein GLUTAMINE DUMPER 6-like protein n=1 Tax=Carex littledalei TaxID=544730 RepID=A0A833QTR7_9POAL|nr:protein GLUTAMINE DUMPER 6-like protein [Carex littledalei]
MTPAGVSSSSFAKSSLWHSPVPYLFTGIGVMMILIAVALAVLACSHKKRPQPDVESSPLTISPVDREPPIFVIVPGEMLPSFVAKPAVANNLLSV